VTVGMTGGSAALQGVEAWGAGGSLVVVGALVYVVATRFPISLLEKYQRWAAAECFLYGMVFPVRMYVYFGIAISATMIACGLYVLLTGLAPEGVFIICMGIVCIEVRKYDHLMVFPKWRRFSFKPSANRLLRRILVVLGVMYCLLGVVVIAVQVLNL